MKAAHKTINVAAAVIENSSGKILIAKRPQHVHQGGLWEFPGGKIEKGESLYSALHRELHEELNIQISGSKPLIQIHHHYPDKSVFLNVRHVTQFKGTAIGNEGQEIQWVDKKELNNFNFPAANKPIINAIQLPQEYLITPSHNMNERDSFLERLTLNAKNGAKLIQLRAKNLSTDELTVLHSQTISITEKYCCRLQINTTIQHAQTLNLKSSQLNGVHLTSRELLNTQTLPAGIFVSASCHNQEEIQKACKLGVNFIVISPVNFTTSHPDTTPIGWQSFQQLSKLSSVPTYALGGTAKTDINTSIFNGGQGVAAITSLW